MPTQYRTFDDDDQARADALTHAADCMDTVDNDALIRAAHWILTGEHPLLTDTDQAGDETVMDGGDVSGSIQGQDPTTPRLGVRVPRLVGPPITGHDSAYTAVTVTAPRKDQQ